MYLHLGQNTIITANDIIGIFDIELSTYSTKTIRWLNRMEKEGKIFNVSFEIPKSFIVCKQKNDFIVYLSQLSTATLLKRINVDFNIEDV